MHELSKKEQVAIAALQGMLSHSTRYKASNKYSTLSWHEAIVKEAFDIATEFVIESSKRG